MTPESPNIQFFTQVKKHTTDRVTNNIGNRKSITDQYDKEFYIIQAKKRNNIKILQDLNQSRKDEHPKRQKRNLFQNNHPHKAAYQYRYENISAVRSYKAIVNKERDEYFDYQNYGKCQSISHARRNIAFSHFAKYSLASIEQ